jgi:hypothetical protein
VNGGSLSRLTVQSQQVRPLRPRTQETIIIGLISNTASTTMLSGMSSHTSASRRGKAERARAKAERAQEKAAQAQAVRAEAEAKVAGEQAAALARALHEDEAHRQADLREVAEKEAEAVPEWPPDL